MLTRVDIKEAERMLGCSRNTIYRGIESGKMPIARVVQNEQRKTYYIYKEKIEAWKRGEL